MIETWFIADTHFSHTKILEYEKENRPFASIEEHDEELIKRWNSVVKPNDNVYHLGDFSLGGRDKVVEIGCRLNGNKRLIMGNHDVYPMCNYLAVFKRIYSALFWKEFFLSHVPLHPDHTKCMVNIHGHTHSRKVMNQGAWCIANKKVSYPAYLSTDQNYFCVSAEQNNLTPINVDEIREKLK